MEETGMILVNALLLIIVFSLVLTLIFKSISAHLAIKRMEYLVYKPLFPFELPPSDPYRIDLQYKRSLVDGES